MSKQLSFGFVGAGEIAVASATAVKAASHAALARVYDTRADLAGDLAAKYGGQPAESVKALLADEAVQAVYICTPHFLHKDLAIQAANAGKHVFIEKPLGVSPVEAQAIVAACKRNGVECGVPFIVRYAPAYHEAHRLVQSGAIGKVTGFRLTYRGDKPPSYWNGGYSGRSASDWRQTWAKAGGGVMIMNTIHDLDAVLWITGLDVERVQGLMANMDSPGEVEDYALALFTCSGGALGSLEALAALPGGQGPSHPWINRIYGRQGQILLPTPWGTGPLALFTREAGQWREITPEATADARQLTFEEFAAAVLAGLPVPIPGEAALKASSVIHAVYESARRGEPVAVHLPRDG
jgi:UDP-N-acetyl-2-amino-2-deoxyglucuronate dehydrogenase